MKLTSIAGTLGKIIGVLIIIVWVWLPFYAFSRQLKFEREAVKVINEHAAAIDDHAKSLRITAYLLNGGTNRQGSVLQWNPLWSYDATQVLGRHTTGLVTVPTVVSNNPAKP